MAKNKKIKNETELSSDEKKQNITENNNKENTENEVIIEQKKDEIIEEEIKQEKEAETKQEENKKTEEENKYDSLLVKFDEMTDKYARLSAEFDNYRKRTLKEKMDLIQNGGSDVLKSILPVLDNLERAITAMNESSDLESVKDGVELIYKNFLDFLKQRGVTEIVSKGESFNTDIHEAIAQMPAENKKQKGKIIDVIEKGYKLNDKVLRFAKVVVAQ